MDITLSYVNSDPVALPQAWDGSSVDLRKLGSATIWCTAAPAAAPTIEASGDGVRWDTVAAVLGDFSGTTTAIAATGKYDLSGGCRLRLNGGTGGTYLISGSN